MFILPLKKKDTKNFIVNECIRSHCMVGRQVKQWGGGLAAVLCIKKLLNSVRPILINLVFFSDTCEV